MVELNKFQKVTDGFQLNQGFYNGIVEYSARPLLLNTITQLQDRSIEFSADGGMFAEAYTEVDGRLDSVEESGALFSSNKYVAVASETEPYVIIEADSLTASSFNKNDCQIISTEVGKWQLSCSSGTDEEKRAKIHNTLFYGGASSALATAENVTALKTNVSRDVGKRGIYVTMNRGSLSTNDEGTYTGTFSNTTTNTDVSSWSICEEFYYNPNSSYFNEDRTAKEQDNPSTCSLYLNYDDDSSCLASWRMPGSTALHNSSYTTTNGGSSNRPKVYVLILSSDSISWAYSGDSGASVNNYDSVIDGNVPEFTSLTEDYYNVIVHNIPSGTFSSTFQNGFLTAKVVDWEEGANIQYKLANYSFYDGGDIDESDGFTDSANAFDHDDSTRAYRTSVVDISLGKTFPDMLVEKVSVKASISTVGVTTQLYFEYYDGSSWIVYDSASASGPSIDESYDLNRHVQGVRVRFSPSGNNETCSLYILDISELSDDTGYGDFNEILTSEAQLSGEPTKLYVKLIPKSVSPTDGVPSISGIGLIGDR